jgi:hypothetical protein
MTSAQAERIIVALELLAHEVQIMNDRLAALLKRLPVPEKRA